MATLCMHADLSHLISSLSLSCIPRRAPRSPHLSARLSRGAAPHSLWREPLVVSPRDTLSRTALRTAQRSALGLADRARRPHRARPVPRWQSRVRSSRKRRSRDVSLSGSQFVCTVYIYACQTLLQGWVACSVRFLSGNACTVLARCTRLALSMDLKDPERSACEVRAVPSPC